jgi:hypothetical protein
VHSLSKSLGIFTHFCSQFRIYTIYSDATKDRFISTYHLPETTHSHKNGTVTSTDYLPLPPALANSRSHSTSNSHHGSVLNFHSKHDSTPPSSRPKSVSKAATGLGLGLPSIAYQDTTTKEKTTGKTKDRALFTATVLELVKLIQAGLSIFGMYGTPSIGGRHIDGLLCDDTVEGIRKWIVLIGEPCVGLEVRTPATHLIKILTPPPPP